MPSDGVNTCLESGPADAQARCSNTSSLPFPTLFPLSTERADIERAIDAIEARGGLTHSTLGVLWAQRMLEPAWRGVWGGALHPADPATSGLDGLRKAIVLLTDGEDTYCGGHNPDCSNSPLAVSRTEACTAAKAQGTEIFVIAAMSPTKVSSDLARTLRGCSSESDPEYPAGTRRPGVNYVFINNATPENLEDAFGDIAGQLRTLKRVY